ncbi:hypothetical protein DL98DRAFT_534804 [Cadophora sp. DSE1049]|nr:hypothetical protein DL98DRAFT_534804 [Cadophora sp. DSE1049]
MAGHVGMPTFHAEYLSWERYNNSGQVPSTIAAINSRTNVSHSQATYGVTPFVLPAPVPPPAPIPVLAPGRPVGRVSQRRQSIENPPPGPAQLALLQRLPGLGNVHGGPN